MGAAAEITQRDLQSRSGDILDALEAGQAFTITRDGREIGELIPVHRRRRFVPRADFSQASLPPITTQAHDRVNQCRIARRRESNLTHTT